jgi:hypothetical protein
VEELCTGLCQKHRGHGGRCSLGRLQPVQERLRLTWNAPNFTANSSRMMAIQLSLGCGGIGQCSTLHEPTDSINCQRTGIGVEQTIIKYTYDNLQVSISTHSPRRIQRNPVS